MAEGRKLATNTRQSGPERHAEDV
uniref:Uncharacterized protein n=1 Tax=Anguilla anguilla TaxID=7936 RepID=A0A0E9RFZ4_ANGAN